MEATYQSHAIVCVGDSITYGDTGLGHRTEHPWPELLQSALGFPVVNCGHNGASSVDWPHTLEHDLALRSMPNADTLILGLGVNDVYHSEMTTPQQAEEVLRRVQTIAEELTAAAGHKVAVCLLSVPQLSEENPVMCRFGLQGIQRMNPLLAVLNDYFRKACPALGWHYLNHADAVNGRRDLHGDSIHPNQNGYDAIAASLEPQLRKVINSIGVE